MTTDLEMLTALGLNKFLDPSNLVDAVVDRRNNPVKGIGAPWSKLQDQFVDSAARKRGNLDIA
jgi:hypothetical protein